MLLSMVIVTALVLAIGLTTVILSGWIPGELLGGWFPAIGGAVVLILGPCLILPCLAPLVLRTITSIIKAVIKEKNGCKCHDVIDDAL